MVAAGTMGDENPKLPSKSDTWTKDVKDEVLKLFAIERERTKIIEEEKKERQAKNEY